MMEKRLPIPGRYRHYKGKEYEVLSIARHSETEEEMVLYRTLYGDFGQWVRPASMCLQWASRVKGNYGSLFDDSTSTLYVNYRRCREDENISMSAFTEEVFARIEAQHPARLVIDLRENGGGSSALFMPFIKRGYQHRP